MFFAEAQWANDELRDFAAGVGAFLDREVTPLRDTFIRNGCVPKDVWFKAGKNGLLGISTPEAYGGLGAGFAHEVVTFAEFGLRNEVGLGLHVHSIVTHYILTYANEEQKTRWLPQLASGEYIGAICMTEPGTGSDLQAIQTTAQLDGDIYALNGSKTFITNGQNANFLIVVAKTDRDLGAKGISLICVETDDVEGFRRGRNLDKIGMKAQDTSELFFDDVRVPKENQLGMSAGLGFAQLMNQLPWERLILSIIGIGVAQAALDLTARYTSERRAFGGSLLEFQNTRFKLADAKAKIEVGKAYLEKCVGKLLSKDGLSATDASIAKYLVTEMQNEIVDNCLQLHGGYGYINEFPIAQMFTDSRVQKIYGGANEIMLELIARSLTA